MMNSSKFAHIVAGLSIAALFVGTASAVPILTFEGPDISGTADGGEGLEANNGGVIGTFGATEGTNALVFANTLAGNRTFFDIGTVNGNNADPERVNNYNQLNSGVGLGGPGISLTFDVSINSTGVTADGFNQIGIFGNSDNGFFGLGFGGLLNGNILENPFLVGTRGVALGVTSTALDAYNPAGGDFIGSYRVTIPISAQNPAGDVPDFGPGGDGVTDFFQLGFNLNSGYTGTATFAFDNVTVGPTVVPEPTALTLIGLGATALLRRRRV